MAIITSSAADASSAAVEDKGRASEASTSEATDCVALGKSEKTMGQQTAGLTAGLTAGQAEAGPGEQDDFQHLPSAILSILFMFLGIVTFSIIIPTADDYTQVIGEAIGWSKDESQVFSGVVIGVNQVIAALTTPVWNKIMQRTSLSSCFFASAAICVISNVMYALAQYAKSPYLLLASRIVTGLSCSLTYAYLGAAVSRRAMTRVMTIASATSALGYAAGPLAAYVLALVYQRGIAPRADPAAPLEQLFNDNTLPGWFMAIAYLGYMVAHHALFREPDRTRGFKKDVESGQVGVRPAFGALNWTGVAVCFTGLAVMPFCFGASEVLTMRVAKSFWRMRPMYASLYLAVLMLLVMAGTFATNAAKSRLGFRDAQILFGAYALATAALPFMLLTTSTAVESRVSGGVAGRWGDMAIFLVVAVLALSFLNMCRGVTMSLLVKLPHPQWRDSVMANFSVVYKLGRGLGPVAAAAISPWALVVVLAAACAVQTLALVICFKHLQQKPEAQGN